jgi:hypothetical protein
MNGSVQSDYPDFICDPNEDDYAVDFTIASGQIDAIRWMIAGQIALMIGTAGGVWAMQGANGQSLTQTSVDCEKQINTGVGNITPQAVNDSIIWVTRSANVVRLLVYDVLTNQWNDPDVTRLARHITLGPTQATSGIIQTAFQKEPYPIFWAVRADGQLLGMTFEKQEQVYAWFRIVTNGVIESVAVVSQDNAEDQVWVVVNRTINGVVQRFVEYFTPQELYGQIKNSFFVHCGLTWQGVGPFSITGMSQATTCTVTAPGHAFKNGQSVQITGVLGMTQANQDQTEAYTVINSNTVAGTFQLENIDSTGWTPYASGGTVQQVTNNVDGMSYLMGEQVVALGDGAIIYQGTVTSDTVVFNYYCNLITIGMPFTTTIEPMNPNIASQQGTSRGKKQKINRVTLSLYETAGDVKYGRDDCHLDTLSLGKGDQPKLITADFSRDLRGEWADEATLCIVHDTPFPFILKAVIPRLSVAEEG